MKDSCRWIDSGVGSDSSTIIAIPPLIVRSSPRWKWYAGQGAAGFAGIRDSIALKQDDSCRHNATYGHNQAKKSSENIFERGPTPFFLNSKEVRADSLHG